MGFVHLKASVLIYFVVVEMAYIRSYWSHLDISTAICPHQIAPVGLELMTLGF